MKQYNVIKFTVRGGAKVYDSRTRRMILINETGTPTEHYGWAAHGYFYFKAAGDTYRVYTTDVIKTGSPHD